MIEIPGLVTDWLIQFGGRGNDTATGVATDQNGHVYVCGYTTSELEEEQAKGQTDAFLAKFDAEGKELWIRQLGTNKMDAADALAVDDAGNIFLTGFTTGSLDGDIPRAKNRDVLLARFLPDGTLDWAQQIGSREWETAYSIDTDQDGNAYLCGNYIPEQDGDAEGDFGVAFISKFNPRGQEIWGTELNTVSNEVASGITVNAYGDVFVCGLTLGEMQGSKAQGSGDAWVAMLDPEGNPEWIRQFGGPNYESAEHITLDPLGNILVAGFTLGELEAGQRKGNRDIFVAKLTQGGEAIWLRQFGSEAMDGVSGIVTGPKGDIYISGSTFGDMGGAPVKPGRNAFLQVMNPSGGRPHVAAFGSDEADAATGLTFDREGNLYLCGFTLGEMGGNGKRGNQDAWLARLRQPLLPVDQIMLTWTMNFQAEDLNRRLENIQARYEVVEETLDRVLDLL